MMWNRASAVLGISLLILNGACKKDPHSVAQYNSKHLRLDVASDIPNFNPIIETDKVLSNVTAFIYEPLVENDQDTFEFIPRLAKTWKISADHKSFEFELDERAKWADGQSVTSADVAYTFQVIFDSKTNSGPLKAVYGSLDPLVQVKDSRHFVIKAKTLHFANFELAGSLPIFPKHILESQDINKAMINEALGSGPYKLESWDKGDRITLTKDDQYWGKTLKQNVDANQWEKIIFKIVREQKVGLEMLKQGFFSAYEFNSEQWERDSKDPSIQNQYDTYKYENLVPKGYSFIGWNNEVEPFSDRNVRLALSHLMNRKLMIEKFTYGYSKQASSPIDLNSIYAPADLKPIEFDPKEAEMLLKKSGWADLNHDGILEKKGKKFEFTLIYGSPDTEKFLTIFQEDLKKAGIICNLKRVDWSTMLKLMDERKFDGITLAWTSTIHPDLEQIWHSQSRQGNGSNFVGYSNPSVDKLIKNIQKEFNQKARILLVQQAARLIAADAPYSFMFSRSLNFVAAKKGIKRPKDFYNYAWGTMNWVPAVQ